MIQLKTQANAYLSHFELAQQNLQQLCQEDQKLCKQRRRVVKSSGKV